MWHWSYTAVAGSNLCWWARDHGQVWHFWIEEATGRKSNDSVLHVSGLRWLHGGKKFECSQAFLPQMQSLCMLSLSWRLAWILHIMWDSCLASLRRLWWRCWSHRILSDVSHEDYSLRRLQSYDVCLLSLWVLLLLRWLSRQWIKSLGARLWMRCNYDGLRLADVQMLSAIEKDLLGSFLGPDRLSHHCSIRSSLVPDLCLCRDLL